MIDLDAVDGGWFDSIYLREDAGKPTLENKAELLRGVGIVYSDRQLQDFRHAIRQGLFELKGECKPSLIVLVYSMVTALSMSDQVGKNEIASYNEGLSELLTRKCPELHRNFS